MNQRSQMPSLTLLADIGGTNTRVALARAGILQNTSLMRYENAKYASFDAVLGAYLRAQGNVRCTHAAIAVAGPVQDGRADVTNLDWIIEDSGVAAVTGARKVLILNDLQAQGYALDSLPDSAITQILQGNIAKPGATRLVVGLGTGFNAVQVYHRADGLFVPPSECGHSALPYMGKTEADLAQYVAKEGALASIEDVLSGRGLTRTYGFCANLPRSNSGPHPAKIIEHATLGNDEAAQKSMALFTRVLGGVLGDLALSGLPNGGIFLVGGVARAITPFLNTSDFEHAFRDKGPMRDLMDGFAISLITSDFAALSGGLNALAQQL